MKTNPKIALVVLITALAIAVFVWAYIKKGQAKKEAIAPKETQEPEDTMQLAVEPVDPIVEQTTTTKDGNIPSKSATPPAVEDTSNSLEILSIEVKYDPYRRAFDYTMNYQGSIVKGIYNDALLPDFNGQPATLLREQHNGAIFEVIASSFSPAIRNGSYGSTEPTQLYTFDQPDIKEYSVSTKGGATQVGTAKISSTSTKGGAEGEVSIFDSFTLGQVQTKPNSVMLSINKADQEVLQWKMVDLITGDIYNGIKGFEESGAAYKEGDLSKKVYYLN